MRSLTAITLVLLAASVSASSADQLVVAIIGTGDIADSLGPRISAHDYRVVYGSRDPDRDSVRALVDATGFGASAATHAAAAAAADVIVLAVPWEAVETVLENLGDVDGKIIVDVTYPIRQAADGYMESSVDSSAGELIQSWRPKARVVKASIPSSYLIDDPSLLGTPPTVMLAANDPVAKETIGQIFAEIGLDPWDAGPIRFSRSIEAFGLLFWVPLLQGRAEGVEVELMRSSFWPCVWNVTESFEPVADRDNLAHLPRRIPPRPCESYSVE